MRSAHLMIDRQNPNEGQRIPPAPANMAAPGQNISVVAGNDALAGEPGVNVSDPALTQTQSPPPPQSQSQPQSESQSQVENAGNSGPRVGQHERQHQHQTQQDPTPARSQPTPLDQMRAYRACLNCRNRKSRCDLDLHGGRPPCRRCTRENKECVLGESHRGGRRVRKKPKLDGEGEVGAGSRSPTQPSFQSSPPAHTPNHTPVPPPQSFGSFDPRKETSFLWQQPTRTATSTSDTTSISRHDQNNLTSPSDDQQFRQRQESTMSLLSSAKPGQRAAIHRGVAPANLQSPSDALEILAQVADRADDGDSPSSDPQGYQQKQFRGGARRPNSGSPKMATDFDYKPYQAGMLSSELVYQYFSSYERFFHPYFPIIPKQTFDRTRLPWLSRHEPHLFSAILTIASKDDERMHQVCYNHMQELITSIIAGADADVDGVEALLLLSQWVSHRPQAGAAVGRGEEDRVAWMYIGNALRLAYFLGVDRTAFKSDPNDDPAKFNRKRLVWVACYICDRQVSVRVGKGFWARGPGPLSGLKANDFPTLQPLSQNEENWAIIFQANLELTQILSNVHDILYSSKDHGWKEMLEGRYAKYLDDFRASIRSWKETWGNLICAPQLKASLILTFDYLRLYVNAFAYQATISRALTFQRDSQHRPNRSIPLIDASAPDARFIYEALDAAKSLLSTFNTFVDPETLRYMPVSYYLFIIYSAVFLYKARLTTTMTETERTEVRNMINQTIDRLQQSSMGSNQMGSRYARLLQLLWRKSPKPSSHVEPTPAQSLNTRLIPLHQGQNSSPQPGQFDPNQFNNLPGIYPPPPPAPQQNNAFSWLDLNGTFSFATQNNSVSGGSVGDFDDSMIDPNLSPFDGMTMNLLPHYSFLEGQGDYIF